MIKRVIDGACLPADKPFAVSVLIVSLCLGCTVDQAASGGNEGGAASASIPVLRAEVTEKVNVAKKRPVVGNKGRLSRWRFNGADWTRSEEGYVAAVSGGLNPAMSFDGTALPITDAGSRAMFRINQVERDGHANLNFSQGSIRFMFKPDWSTVSGGPGSGVVLFDGAASGGRDHWRWGVSADGSRIVFARRSTNGAQVSFASGARINFEKDTWYRLLLRWNEQVADVHVDGVLANTSSNEAIGQFGAQSVADGAVSIGSDVSGGARAMGLLDEVEIFGHMLFPAFDEYGVLAAISARIADDSGIELEWKGSPSTRGAGATGYRRRPGTLEWEGPLFTNSVAWSYLDRDPEPGDYYEYFVDAGGNAHHNDRFISAAVRGGPVHFRGRVLLLVDQTLIGDLGDSLEQLEMDLVGDGWNVSRLAGPRHTSDHTQHSRDLTGLSDQLGSFANHHDDLRLIYIIGHVTIPFAGPHNPDGHGQRTFVADGYFGDIKNRDDWERVSRADATLHEYFKARMFPSPLEYGVGRVDFADMPAFSTGFTDQRAAELALLRGYLDRAHRYRLGQLELPQSAHFYSTSGRALESYMARTATRVTGVLFGDDLARITPVNDFVSGSAALWSFHAGTGAHSIIHAGGGAARTTTLDLAERKRVSAGAFYLIDGSYLGEWNSRDAFLRALLASGNGLGSAWARGTQWRFHGLGVGSPIGLAVRDSINLGVSEKINYLRATYLTYLGDPTLRMQILDPPTGLTVAKVGNEERLVWNGSDDPEVHYHVYRSTAGSHGPYQLVTARQSTWFADDRTTGSDQKGTVYQVRAAKLVRTGGGSFTNLSQATFWPPPY